MDFFHIILHPGFLHCRRLGQRMSPALGQRGAILGPSGDMIDICQDINLDDRHLSGHQSHPASLTGSSVAGGLRILHFSRVGRQPGCMAHSKTYNSLVLLLMSQDGAVLQSNPPPQYDVVHKLFRISIPCNTLDGTSREKDFVKYIM